MPNTATSNYNYTIIEVGANADQWGSLINTNTTDIDADLFAVSTVANAALPKAGGTMTGVLVANSPAAGGAGHASLRLPHGTAPTTNLTAGDMWTTLSGAFININGTTKTFAFTDSNITGNAATATALATGRTIGMTGDVVWTSAAFTGAGNVTGTAEIQAGAVGTTELATNAVTTAKINDGAVTAAKLAATAVTPGSYGAVTAIPVITVDQQGRITAASTAALTGAFSEYFESSEIALGSGTSGVVAHGLSGRPKMTQVIYRCKTTDAGYSVGDEVVVSSGNISGSNNDIAVNTTCSSSGTDSIRYVFSATKHAITNASTGVAETIAAQDYSKWRVVIRAWY